MECAGRSLSRENCGLAPAGRSLSRDNCGLRPKFAQNRNWGQPVPVIPGEDEAVAATKFEFDKLVQHVAALEKANSELSSAASELERRVVALEKTLGEQGVANARNSHTPRFKTMEGLIAALEEKSFVQAAEVENLRSAVNASRENSIGAEEIEQPQLSMRSLSREHQTTQKQTSDLYDFAIHFASHLVELNAWKEHATSHLGSIEDRISSLDRESTFMSHFSKPSGEEKKNESPREVDTPTAHEEIMEAGFYKLKRSVYDVAVLMSSRLLDGSNSIVILLGIFASAAMQIILLYLLSESAIFDPFADSKEGFEYRALMWRHEHAHALENMIVMQNVSLAHAVCDLDSKGLAVASQQVEFIQTVRSYTKPIFSFLDVPQGCCMIMVVMLLWICVILQEIYDSCRMIIALASVKHGPGGSLKVTQTGKQRTRFTIEYLPHPRFWTLMLLHAIRLFIAFYLCWLGCRWLVQSLKIEELVLNAIALAFIRGLDELMFESIVSLEVKWILDRMSPLAAPEVCGRRAEGRKPRMLLFVPIFTISFGAALWFFFMFWFEQPYLETLRAAEQHYCGGLTDFVVWRDEISGSMRWKWTSHSPQLLNLDPAQVLP